MRSLKTLLYVALLSMPLAAQVHLGGDLETYNRYWVHADSGRWTWNENRLQLQLEANPAENLHLYGELRLRAFGFPRITGISDLQRQQKDRVYPWALEIREAYADLYDFLVPGLDLRLGRQVIAWGTADKINPTSNLSPYDYEDFFDFGAKLGVNALRAIYTRDPWSLEVDVVPVFTPATLPPAEWSGAMMPLAPSQLPPLTVLRNTHFAVATPEPTAENTQVGVKLGTTLADWDLSVSYYRGFDGLPLADTIRFVPVDTTLLSDLEAHLVYPRIQVFGADLAGSFRSVGLWAEGALVVPETFVQVIYPAWQPLLVKDTLLKKPYLKFVLGGDYTFKNGLYVNAQYIHGFLHERGPDSLRDYFVVRLEKRFHNDEVTLAPLTFAAEVADWDAPGDHYGYAWIPELKYAPTDNLEIRLGAFVLDGKPGTLFGRMKTHDEVFLRIKVSF